MCVCSDSDDSLFITQKPVPGAVRAGKRRRTGFTSSPESEDDASSSASHGEPTAAGKGQRKKFRLPKYSFPFLSEKKCGRRSRLLPVQQNTGLHVRITNDLTHAVVGCALNWTDTWWLVVCYDVFPLHRMRQWEASLNVSERCGRDSKQDTWSCLYQRLTWMWLHCQSKFHSRNNHLQIKCVPFYLDS